MAAPRDVRGEQDEKAAHQVQHDAEVPAVEAVDEHATEEGHEETGDGHDDDLPTDFDGGMRGREDVPAHAREVHAAAKQRHEHGHKEVAESALRPDQVPIDSM